MKPTKLQTLFAEAIRTSSTWVTQGIARSLFRALALAGLLLTAACQRTAPVGGTSSGSTAAAGGASLKMPPEEVIQKMEAYNKTNSDLGEEKTKQMGMDLRWMESPQFYPEYIYILEPLTKTLRDIKPGHARFKITVVCTKLKPQQIGISAANWILTIDGEKISPESAEEFPNDREYKANGAIYSSVDLTFQVKSESLVKDLEKFTLENSSEPKRLWSINAKEILPRYQKIRENDVSKGKPVVIEVPIGGPRWPFVPVLVDQ